MPIFNSIRKKAFRKTYRKLPCEEEMSGSLLDFGNSVIGAVSKAASSALAKFGDLTGTRAATDNFRSLKAASEFMKSNAQRTLDENKRFTSDTYNAIDEIKSQTNKAKEATLEYAKIEAERQTDPYKYLAQGDLKAAGGAYIKSIDPGQSIVNDAKYLKKLPLVSYVYKQVDNYSGGLIERGVSASSMPGKLVRGDTGLGLTDEKVSKAEFIQNMVFYAQVAMIVASGGSAATLIGFMSQQMKQGPLGETETGRTILTVGTIAAIAATGGTGSISQNLQAAAAKEAKRRAAQEASLIISEETGTGKSGQIAVQSAFMTGDASSAATAYASEEGKKIAVAEISKKTGTTGGLLTSMSLEMLEASNGSLKTDDGQTAYIANMKAHVLEQARKTAIQIAKAEAEKRIGAKNIALATEAYEIYQSDDISQTLKDKAYAKIYAKSQSEQNKLLTQQQKDLIAAAKTNDPDKRLKLTLKIAEDEAKIYDIQKQRDSALKEAGLSSQILQDNLTQNAQIANVSITRSPSPLVSKEKRITSAEKFKNERGKKLANHNKIMIKNAEETKNLGEYLKTLADRSRMLREASEQETDMKKRAAMVEESKAIDAELVANSDKLSAKENEVISQYLASKEFEAKSGVELAAIEEGRYWYGYEYSHPMLKYGLVSKRG